ncbi:MAG: hypothetical protein FJX76_28830, partial [Armatimonadetes bacterium]|nr:hypothetical protein [Armatimonadota bacterium]
MSTGLLPGRSRSFLYGLNYGGTTAGHSDGGGHLERAIIHTETAGITDVSGGWRSIATAINDTDRFCGWRVDGPFRAYVHDGLSSATAADALQSVWGLLTVALSLNNNGQVVGYDRDGANNTHAALWSPNGTSLPGGAGHDLNLVINGPAPSSAEHINDLGEIVGWDGYVQRAFRWNDLDGVTYLAPAGLLSNAQSINAHGVAVGWDDVGTLRAVSFDPVLGPRYLDTLIGSVSGVTLREAVDINDAGQILCRGLALDGGSWVATSFVLTPVPQARLASITVTPSAVVGGENASAVVSLDSPAPPGGVVVNLASSDPAIAQVSTSTVFLPEGITSVSFVVTTLPQAADETAAITASAAGVTRAAALTVEAPTPTSVSLNPASVRGGQDSMLTVTLSGAAPPAGLSLALTSSSPEASAPAVLPVDGGATQASTTVGTTPVALDRFVTLTATYNGVSAEGTLAIAAPRISLLAVSPTSVYGGFGATGTVTLDSVAPAGGLPLTLGANSPAAQVPPTATVPGGQTSVSYPVTTTP